MQEFADAWKQYPILYDEQVRNRHFSQDFKGTAVYMRQCYSTLAVKLNTTEDDMRKRRIKYVDGVTKALGQLKEDIMSEQTLCPIPAMYKLITFRWLWPYSKNYDEQLMAGVVFDDYMDRALTRDLKKLTRAKQDITMVLKALSVVKEFLANKALAKLDLKSTTDEEIDGEPFHDASALCDIATVEECWMTTSVCEYLPPSRDPTYNYAEAGFASFHDSVSVCDPSCSGKGIRRQSDALLSALKQSGEAGAKAMQALRQAQHAEHLYYGSCLAIVAHNVMPVLDDNDKPFAGDKSKHSSVHLLTTVLRRYDDFEKSIFSAVKITKVYKQEYSKLREIAQPAGSVSSCSASRSKRAVDDIAMLRKLWDKLKLF